MGSGLPSGMKTDYLDVFLKCYIITITIPIIYADMYIYIYSNNR